MNDLHNAVCLTYIYPNGTHDNLTGVVIKLKRVGLPNAKHWVGEFHPYGGHAPVGVIVTNLDTGHVEPLRINRESE